MRAARERKDLTLAAIAQATKVSESHFARLERADLGHWPKGVFRRAFVRDYIRMIGLPVDPTFDEFVRLFPDEDASRDGAPRTEVANELRMTLACTPLRQHGHVAAQTLAAMIDLGAVLLVAGILAWWAPVDPWTTTAVIALCYYPLTTACFGKSLTSRWIRGRRQRHIARSSGRRSGPLFHAGGVLGEPGSRAHLVKQLLWGHVSRPPSAVVRFTIRVRTALNLSTLRRAGGQ